MRNIGWRIIGLVALALFPLQGALALPITLDSKPDGAWVFVNGAVSYRGQVLTGAGGQPLLTSPTTVADLPIGTHRLTFIKPGYSPAQLRINVCPAASCPDGTNVTLFPRRPERYSKDESRLSAGNLVPPSGINTAAKVRLEDWDFNGRADLVWGDCVGQTIYYQLNNSVRDIGFSTKIPVDIPLPGGVDMGCPTPFPVDWNNDGIMDLLVGLPDGRVLLAPANSVDLTGAHVPLFSLASPVGVLQFFDGVSYLPVMTAGAALPWVMDVDWDGRKDLVLAGYSGMMQLFPNVGTDAAPVLGPPEAFGPTLLTGLNDITFVDMDYNGTLDLITIYDASGGGSNAGIWVYPDLGQPGEIQFSDTHRMAFQFNISDGNSVGISFFASNCPPPHTLSFFDVAVADRQRSREMFLGCGTGSILQFRPRDGKGDLNGDGVVNGADMLKLNLGLGIGSASPDYNPLIDVPRWQDCDGATPSNDTPTGPLPGQELSFFKRDNTINLADRLCLENEFGWAGTDCGNGTLDLGEACDDGNLKDNDGCSSICRVEPALVAQCGDGLPNVGELCDDGPFNGQPCFCNSICAGFVLPVCGDGKLCDIEYCDDGDSLPSGYCNATCTGPGTGEVCGNGVVEGSEVCDFGLQTCCNSTCTGARPPGQVCRAAVGECDLDEVCEGANFDCPLDLNVLDGTPCAPDGEFCSGIEACLLGVCVSPGNPCVPVIETCNEAADICDPVGGDCGNGTVEAGELCDFASQTCCNATCDGWLAAGTVCRAAADECDLDESCTGLGADCPVNMLQPNGSPCTDDGLFCSGIETCQGGVCSGAGDPCAPGIENCNEDSNQCEPLGPVCGNGVVEGGETCDPGINFCCNSTCDGVLSAGTVCRTANGPCDITEVCGGVTPVCPANQFRPAGFMCGTICDPDLCNSSGQCINQPPAPPTTYCGAGLTEPCCNPDQCNGAGQCMDFPITPNGTPCLTCGPLGSMCMEGVCQ